SANTAAKGGASNVTSAGRSNGGASGSSSKQTAAGANATGGMDAVGGDSAGGASSCSWESAPESSNGELTCYWFGQGTPNNFVDECPNGFKTSCGYCGSEKGKKDQANPYPCAIGEVTNAVEHIPTEHFVAFPNNSRGDYCGMCVEVTYRGVTITATVIDYCASCQTAGHIDLSLSAAEALGMVEWNGNPKSGITWKVVGCPATEDIFVSYNGGKQTRQAYFKNLAFPIKTAKFEGKEATLNTGFWDFGAEVAGKTVTLTDVLGYTIEGTMPTALPGGTFGAQFPLTCE
ncbi:MAG TPA: RlpA-like double-psi beta-barrel domain-containing protein, partial [Polyangiaceae bacterium]|nr:RlpA-like double-psi beta-barrel domain-containing protein [Polyangiaceae bacterium]